MIIKREEEGRSRRGRGAGRMRYRYYLYADDNVYLGVLLERSDRTWYLWGDKHLTPRARGDFRTLNEAKAWVKANESLLYPPADAVAD